MSSTATVFIEQARQGLAEQTAAHSATWHFGEEESWEADLDEGILRLHLSNEVSATTQVQVVGTYNPEQESFLWGWDHPPFRKHFEMRLLQQEVGAKPIACPPIQHERSNALWMKLGASQRSRTDWLKETAYTAARLAPPTSSSPLAR
jgi:hypothetical protein